MHSKRLINPNRQATPEARDAVNNLRTFANNAVQGQLPKYFYEGYCASCLVPANKEHPDQLNPGNIQECRPINIDNAEKRLIKKAYFDEGLQEAYVRILGPVQNEVGIRGGIFISTFGVQAALDANSDFAIFQGDIKNGYNEILRESILAAMKEQPDHHNTLVFTHLTLYPSSYIAMGSGTDMTDAGFRVKEGVQQGAVPSRWLYSLGQNSAMQNHRTRTEAVRGGVIIVLNNNTTIATKEDIFTLSKQLAKDLATVRLKLQPHKSKCYIDKQHRDDRWNKLWGIINKVRIEYEDGNVHYSITTCNILVRSETFVKTYLNQKMNGILKRFTSIPNFLDPG
jgi:hypothetical protein